MVTKVFSNEIVKVGWFKRLIKSVYTIRFEKVSIDIVLSTFISSITFLFNIINIGVGIYLIFNMKLSLGMFTSFNEYSSILKNILLYFSELNYELQKSSVSISRLEDLYQFNNDIQMNEIQFDEDINEITIRNLGYETQDGVKVLDDLNLVFTKGNIYVLVGRSGAGKSTVLNILNGLITNYNGAISVGTVDLRKVNTKSLRKKISYVTQDSFLFSSTIRENITLGMDIAEERIIEVCSALNIHNRILDLSYGYDTKINEDGLNLSGGERQRICIARGLVCNSDVYLLDEITASIDEYNTSKLIEAIEQISENAIVIIISHDDLNFTKEINLCQIAHNE